MDVNGLFVRSEAKEGRSAAAAGRSYFLVTQEASSVELGTWCRPRVVLIEKRPSANITVIPLPPKCPELNTVENVWQFMPDIDAIGHQASRR
jgi:hypothetical protein